MDNPKIEDIYTNRATVSPHWLPGGNTFWYRRYLSPEEFEFVFVDAASKKRQPAFDHTKLAEALRQQGIQDVESHKLPFTWIDLSPDGTSTRFTCNGKKWAYESDCTLKEWDGIFEQSKRQLLTKERPSRRKHQHVAVNFVNQTGGVLSKYWIGWDGKPIFYNKIGTGKVDRQQTITEHVWKLVDDKTEDVKAIFVAIDGGKDTLVIDDNTMAEAACQDEKECTEEEKEEEKEKKTNPKISDLLFIQDYQLWATDPDGTKSPVSSNDTVENQYDGSRIFTSRDLKFAVVWQFTPEEEHKLHLRESAPADQLQPKVRTVRYLKPGDRVRVDRPRLFSLEYKSEVPTDDAVFKNPYKIQNIGWNSDGSEYYFVFNERGHQTLRVIGINISGNVKALVEDSSGTFIDYSSKLYHRFFKKTNELIWASERDGFNHLYLFDLTTGELKNQITKGEWNVHSVTSIDEDKREIWFEGYGMVASQDPYHAHMAHVNFDGSGFKVLTEGDGTHIWACSPAKRYFVDTWSRVDSVPESALRDMETGELVLHLRAENNDTSQLVQDGWVAPERFEAPGRDGRTLIYGIIIRPSDFDSSKIYPVLEDIYAGPHDFHTPKKFSSLSRYRKWADQGYIVVALDGMGTNWRSKKFQDVCYKNLKDAGFPDRIAWIKAAAKTRPWMDTSRVGVMGASAGGQNAVAALLHHSDFYKVAIADSGCHDNRMDKIWWNEQWMGYPVDKSYEDSSNVVHANKLQGALMLIVGDLDDNVDPASTLQLVKALNDADKEYELLFIPGGEHGCGRSEFATKRQERFLKKHLLV
ncbi:peptidase s9b dipeptidylpeptidase iv domain protein [Colletotrichum truncatum]|uniref:Peptidase s9b dipeptidylpeptidase iv domain protein n=1 Tax=Colletotrichum truncatum TaxID=5467 RepID=A0ACC3YMX2_COLTU|nr:peptidase s9b dipeptidylpeptidase iv domain protein [Colletotrichum truncatum]KAF6792090.1 peptidase s9b dipeptidylpeptidase iv domain protein [Colletotrichum truncatum]